MEGLPNAGSARAAPVNVNGLPAVASAIVLGTIGVLSFIVQPGIVQGFVAELGLAEPQAVNLAGVAMLGVAIAAILLAFVGNRLNWRMVVIAGLAVAIAGNILSVIALESSQLGLARFVAGLGHGLVISISFTFIGITRNAERNLALYLVLLLTYGAFGLWYLPSFLDAFGFATLFYAFAAICAAAMVTALYVPAAYHTEIAGSPRARQLGSALMLVALAGVLAYNLAQGIAWGILALVGIGAGHPEQAVATALFLSQIVAVGGALCAVFLAERINSHLAIVLGIFGGAASISLLIGDPSYSLFLIAVCGFNLLWNFVMPFVLAKVCEFEIRGRMMSYAIALQMIGLGGGPLLAAPLIAGGSYLPAELVCIAMFIASYVLLVGPMRSHQRLLTVQPES